MQQLSMSLKSLKGLPPLQIPEGYELRPARADEAEVVAELLQKAFPEMVWDAARASKELLDEPLVATTFLLLHEGKAVFTASAKHVKADDKCGYVHWVGGDPAYAGKGLGFQINLAVLHEFVRLGKTSGWLHTDDVRLAAIKTYLKLGFTPNLTDRNHRERWEAIQQILA